MQASLHLQKDTITPDLIKWLRVAANPRKPLRAAGTVVVSLTQRAFNEPALRPAAWKPLKRSTQAAKARKKKSDAILKSSGTLWRSFRIINQTSSEVVVGTGRFYAKFHQLGGKHLPARPFMPFTPQGRLVGKARRDVELALRRALENG